MPGRCRPRQLRKSDAFWTRCRKAGQLDNTLVIFLMGDNGASAEGTLQGTTNEVATAANGVTESIPYLLSMIDQLGGPLTYNHYPVGWAHAMDAPMQWTKQVASHFGGTRNGLVISWPAASRTRADSSQFCPCHRHRPDHLRGGPGSRLPTEMERGQAEASWMASVLSTLSTTRTFRHATPPSISIGREPRHLQGRMDRQYDTTFGCRG